MDAVADRADPGVPPGRVRAVSRDRLFFACLLCAAAALLFVGCAWLAFPSVAVPISIAAAICNAPILGLALVARRRRIPRALLPATGAALAILIYATLLYSFIEIESATLTIFVVMIVFGAGVMQSSQRWLATTLVLVVGSWLVAGLSMLGTSFLPIATGLILAAFVAQFLHLFVIRHLLHIKELRRRDREHGAELAAALAAATHELVERHRAEAEREKLREQLLHAQKLEAVGTLAGGVAHDMNNMLAAILGMTELARDEPATAPQAIEQIGVAARRASELVRNLLGFSRRGQYSKERVELSSVVASIAVLLSRTLPKEIELVTSDTARHAVEGDVAQIGQVVLNLGINASDAMSGRGVLRVDVGERRLTGEAARAVGVTDGLYVWLRVTDTGCGMDASTRARMFEPFFTTKEPGRGTGLGLAMVYGTVTHHDGGVEVDSEVGRGTAITVYLPAVEAVAELRPIDAETPASARPRTVTPGDVLLVVDDEPLVRSVTRRSLERAGYKVLTASDGAEGLAVYQEHADEIRVVVLDMAMPVMGGAECFRRLRAVDPSVRVLLASGYALENDARACLAEGALGFLEKPFRASRLVEAVALARAGRQTDVSAP
jgi:signal transduction histidine kinase/CheY-like chemotaxis protein